MTRSSLTYAPALVLPVSDRDHVRGPRSAPLTLVEYADFECPYCGAAEQDVSSVQHELSDRLCFVYRHFPLANIHPYAWGAAEASEAAAAQGRFWEMHDLLFANQEALDAPDLIGYARTLGLDLARFAEELGEGVYAPRVDEDFRSGVLSGVNGTPTFFINGVRHDGAHDAQTLLAALSAKLE